MLVSSSRSSSSAANTPLAKKYVRRALKGDQQTFSSNKSEGNNIESFNSVSSSGYLSHNGAHFNNNNAANLYPSHRRQSGQQVSPDCEPAMVNRLSMETLRSRARNSAADLQHQHQLQHQNGRQQLSFGRQLMVPMMIEAEIDGSHLIDDDMDTVDEVRNNADLLYGRQHRYCVDSTDHQRSNQSDDDPTMAQDEDQISYLRAYNGDINFAVQQNGPETATAAARQQQQQIDQGLVYAPKSIAQATYSKHYPVGGFAPLRSAHLYQPQVEYQQQANPTQYQQVYHSFAYQQNPLDSATFDPNNNYSNQANGSNKQLVGPPIGPASNQQVNALISGKKMQGSRQQLTSNSSSHYQHQHHRHHHNNNSNSNNNQQQQQNLASKRKSGAKRKPQRSKSAVMEGKPALSCCGKLAKLLLFLSNISFWVAGFALGAWGVLSLVEDHKYSLSQLLVFEPNSRMSLFQLLAWSFITLGCATVLVGFCGCSAILKNNRWILGLYIFLILAIFALDLATGLLAIIFQEKLVANVRLRLINKLRSEYGIQASFTAAIDYIQTRFECCGLEGHFDYDQSLWRLQRLGGFEATVARTCCHLRNTFDDQAHINPRPVNESMCQSTDVRFHQSYRYRKGCLDELERLIRQKIWTFTIGCSAVGAIILLSLVFATCFCRSIPSNNSRKNSSPDREQQQQQLEKKQITGSCSVLAQLDQAHQRNHR